MLKSRKKQILTISSIAVLTAAMASIGVVLAILAKNVESRANVFTFSNMDITLTEPEWKDDPVVYPGAENKKDPTVTNTGANPLYVYLQVKIPRGSVDVVKVQDGKEYTALEVHDLLRYSPDPNVDWVKIIDSEDEEDQAYGEDGYHVVIYAYELELAPKESTSPLFETVIFSEDILEAEPGVGTSLDMPITAYAIQSRHLNTTGDDLKTKLTNAFKTHMDATQNQK